MFSLKLRRHRLLHIQCFHPIFPSHSFSSYFFFILSNFFSSSFAPFSSRLLSFLCFHIKSIIFVAFFSPPNTQLNSFTFLHHTTELKILFHRLLNFPKISFDESFHITIIETFLICCRQIHTIATFIIHISMTYSSF